MRRSAGRPVSTDPSAGPRGRRWRKLAAIAAVAAVVVAAAVTGGLAGAGVLTGGTHAAHSPRRTHSAEPFITAPVQGLTPAQMAIAYDLTPLASAGITGAGQTIVIVDSFGSPTITSDLAHFDRYFKLPAPASFRVIQPAGPVPAFHPGDKNRVGWAEETTLDVEWAHVLAPGASILLVETPTSENEGTTGFPQIVAAEKYVLRHRLGQVISQSFAATEQTFPSNSALQGFRSAYELAARDHVTVVTASGDQGATSFKYNMKDLYTRPAVSWPATDPLVTAVGGTQLDLRADGSRRKPDVAWHDSGGGKSIAFARPAYQNGVRALTGNARGVPDISMDGSCASGVVIYGGFYHGQGEWKEICGTSLSAPLFAGIVALADQYAGHGQPHGLGVINPAIYTIAARHEPGIVGISSGDNTQKFTQHGKTYTVQGFTATGGYNLVTGVGTVDAAHFVPELAKLAG